MNKTNLLAAPFFALFSKDFYRSVMESSLGRAFLYLFYLSGIFIISIAIGTSVYVLPQVDRFVEWAKKEMPPLVWTPEGLQMTAQSPVQMIHPQLGPLVTFDMNAGEINPETMGPVRIFVTSKRVYYRERPGQLRMADLTAPKTDGQPVGRSLVIDAALVQKIYGQAKPIIFGGVLVFMWIFFYVIQLLQALIASLVGLVINLFRREKLKYGAIFKASVFAATAPILLDVLKTLLPVLNFIPSGFWVYLLLTGLYLFVAVKLTENPANPSA